MPYIVIQEEGGFQPLDEWAVEASSLPEVRFRENARWEKACEMLVRRAEREQTTPNVNVFLIFDKEEVLDLRDRPFLVHLLTQARERSWGARVFAVMSSVILSRDLGRGRQDLGRWIEELVAGRVTDLLQIRQELDLRHRESLWTALRDAASTVDDRRQMLRAVNGQRRWRCALPTKKKVVAQLLAPWAILDPSDEADSDLVIVIMTDDAGEQELVIDKYFCHSYSRACLVVTVRQKATDRLKKHCFERGLGEPLSLEGEFELWYFLLLLNQPARIASQEDLGSIHPVQLATQPLLKSPEPSSLPSVLLTCAFGMGPEETPQWLVAATDVGELLHRAPFEMEYRVELAIRPAKLIRILELSPSLNVWIHMGHGKARSGLWIPGEELVLPEQWIQCFFKRDLRLALFLTCESHELARRFAQAGAGVAIGFEGEVESTTCRELAIEVLKAILVDGTRGGAILAGFKTGVPRFEAVQVLNAQAKAYYPRRR